MINAAEVRGLELFASALADKAGLTLRLYEASSADYPGPSTNGKTINMPYLPIDAGYEQRMTWMCHLYHEIGHNTPKNRDAFKLLKSKKNPEGILDGNSFLGFTTNIVEDIRPDLDDLDVYEGKRVAYSVGWAKAIQDAVAAGTFTTCATSEKKQHQALGAMMHADLKMRRDVFPSIDPLLPIIEDQMNEQQHQWSDQIIAKYGDEYMDNTRPAIRSYEIAKDICDNIFKLTEEEQQDGARDFDGTGKADLSAEEGENGEEGSESGAGKPGDKGGKKAGKAAAKGGKVSYHDLMIMHKHSDDGEDSYPSGVRISYDDLDSNGYEKYQLHKPRDWKIHDFVSGVTKTLDGRPTKTPYSGRHPEVEPARVKVDRTFAAAVRRQLEIATRTTYHRGQRRGRISKSDLYHTTVPNSVRREKVFKRKHINNALDTAVYILVDYSGSMAYNGKVDMATAAGMMLADCMSALNIPFELSTFTDRAYYGMCIGLISPFYERRPSQEEVMERMKYSSTSMWQNSDGEAVLFAYQQLVRRSEQRKVLFVLSDGSPMSDQPGDCFAYTKNVVQQISQPNSGVEVYGIGILDSNVNYIYPKENVRVIKDINHLPKSLLEMVKRYLIAG